MPFNPEQKREYMRKWRESQREKREAFKAELALCAELDQKDIESGGKRYKSECRSYKELSRLYYGLSATDSDGDEDEEEVKPTKKGPQPVLLKPAGELILGKSATFWEWLDLRDRARKDLFWLGKTVCRKDLIPEVHQVVCDQFVKKNFDGTYYDGYGIRDVQNAFTRLHETRDKIAMILDQRGGYKSTINMLDAVQWMLNAPDCRVMVLTETRALSKKFRRQFKKYFYKARGGKLNTLQLLFPEYILTGARGNAETDYFCPAAILEGTGDPSLFTTSVESAMAGFHCDVEKMDDAVSDKNSKTEELRENVVGVINLCDELLDPHGFKDIIGTRYFSGKNPDYYGYLINLREKKGFQFKYFCRGCWVVKEGYEAVELPDLTEDMVICTFPQKFPFRVLREELLKNHDNNFSNFRNQKLNEPIDSEAESDFRVNFPIELLYSHARPLSAANKDGEVYCLWDWAYTTGKSSDYSAGAAVRIYQRSTDGQWGLDVLEIICEKWTPSELAFQIVMFNKKWNPNRTLIEKTICADLLQLEIVRRAQMYGVTLDIWWRKPEQTPDAKRNRIKNLEIKFKDDLLWFCNCISLERAFKQFSEYTGDRKNRGRKDDIPDAISLAINFLPRSDFSNVTEEELQQEANEALRQQMYQRVFGANNIIRPPDAPKVTPPPTTPWSGFNIRIPGLGFKRR